LTANTIENMRRGFEKGILISRKWHRDENTLQRISRGIEVAGTAFHKIRGPAQMAAVKFQALQRVAYALQAVIGSIAGSIGALIGGLNGTCWCSRTSVLRPDCHWKLLLQVLVLEL